MEILLITLGYLVTAGAGFYFGIHRPTPVERRDAKILEHERGQYEYKINRLIREKNEQVLENTKLIETSAISELNANRAIASSQAMATNQIESVRAIEQGLPVETVRDILTRVG